MGKSGLICATLILLLSFSGAESYSVITKSGETIEGKLISETSDLIIIQEASGVHLSLKKDTLDLDKMSEVNGTRSTKPADPIVPAVRTKKTTSGKVFTNADVPGATPEPAGSDSDSSTPETAASPQDVSSKSSTPVRPAPAAKPVAPGKAGKVFTNEDVVPAEPKPENPPVEVPQPQTAPQTSITTTVNAEEYTRELKEGAAQLSKALQDLSALTDGIAVNWEVAASTGNDSKRAVQDYMSGAPANAILNNVSTQINQLLFLQGKLSIVPAGQEPSYQMFIRAVDALKDFQTQVQQYDSIQNMSLLKSRLAELSSQIHSTVGVLSGSEAAQPKV
jgi:hypothetical protein